MSNALAIAAVTTMLDYLITQALARSGTVSLESVTAKPPDKAREGGDSTNQINIFLYQTMNNGAWRNQQVPSRARPGETGRAPLALDLSYLITAYGKNNDDIEGQRLLGTAMQVLHDQPEIRPYDIDQAINSTTLSIDKRELINDSNLKNQIERVRITPQILSLEEVSKMWGTFQAPYRISASYGVSVVLIESSLPVKAPLPVVSTGGESGGDRFKPNLIPPIPTLETLSWPSQALSLQPSLVLGESLTLQGHHLDNKGEPAYLRLSHPQVNQPIELPLQAPVASDRISIQITNTTTPPWRIGFYTLTLRYDQGSSSQFSNALSMAIAPTIDPNTLTVTASTLTLTCTPLVYPGQSVALLLGSQEIIFEWNPDQTQPLNTLTFSLTNVAPGNYYVRLRVDGVDSHLVMQQPDGKFQFNPAYQVIVTG